jgi:hypothetical protein
MGRSDYDLIWGTILAFSWRLRKGTSDIQSVGQYLNLGHLKFRKGKLPSQL